MKATTDQPLPGIPAKYGTECARCGEWVARGERVVHQRGRYIHVECCSGQGDE